jgi:transketolase
MRNAVCDALVARASEPEMVFLTGDLGFMALEPLQEAMGARFINAGVAEQNMISVAAAMASRGHEVWAYSIAPFLYARAFEQIRNDICQHGLSVKLLGNGGGYGYGIYGQSHYALEDYGVLCTLPGMIAYAPLFTSDVMPVVEKAAASDRPAYIRLGRGELPAGQTAPDYAPWRKLMTGPGPVVAAVGAIAGSIWQAALDLPQDKRPTLWGIAEIPVSANPPPAAFSADLKAARKLIVVEEHVAQGGVGGQLAQWCLENDIGLDKFVHRCARSTLTVEDGYGSQHYMRRIAGLDPESIQTCITALS